LNYKAEENEPFRRALIDSIRQRLNGYDDPFVFLDPEFAWTSGFDYWFNKLAPIARQIAGDSPLRPVLKIIAKRIAFIQAFPYHSKSFGAQRTLEKMPSLNEARSFVNDELLQRARSGDALIIVLRGGEKLWGIKRGHPNVVIYEGPETRGAILSPASRGGGAVIERLQPLQFARRPKAGWWAEPIPEIAR
jgi:hypothetical protein